MGAGRALLLVFLGLGAACSHAKEHGPPKATAPEASPDEARIQSLRAFEQRARTAADFAHPPSAETGMGADPWSLQRLPGSKYYVGILRGRSQLVLLDENLRELSRIASVRSPTGLATSRDGEILVAGELSGSIGRYAVRERTLVASGTLDLPSVVGLRDVAFGRKGVVYALDEVGGRIFTVLSGKRIASPIGRGPIQLIVTDHHLVANCLFDHEIVVRDLDASGTPVVEGEIRIKHDGPFWGIDVKESERGLSIAAGGVEDHPLDRAGGFFGYVDSFVFLYRIDRTPKAARRIGAVNVSELGVVTPKAIALEVRGDGAEVTALGYGSGRGVRLTFDGESRTPSDMAVPAGIRSFAPTAVGEWVGADPLLDAWIVSKNGAATVVPIDEPAATPTRLGEALFFTSLMAPWNKSDGALSRFTCETCHFEGYVDGRTHHTGRDDIRATTKPLVGLLGNRPHFSRALDPDLSAVAMNEFRVAGAGNDHDPWFSIDPHEHPWLASMGWHDTPIPPDELRRALITFLMSFSHRANPATASRASFTVAERRGSEAFRELCESCHAARLSADDPATRVPFERWEAAVLSPEAPIVWASADYKETGVVPYVHPRGARVPSLRRLHKKRPYFTNGSAAELEGVLDAVRFGPDAFSHAAAADLTALDAATKVALRAFLELL